MANPLFFSLSLSLSTHEKVIRREAELSNKMRQAFFFFFSSFFLGGLGRSTEAPA